LFKIILVHIFALPKYLSWTGTEEI